MTLIQKLVAGVLVAASFCGTMYVVSLKHRISELNHQIDKNLQDRATALGSLSGELTTSRKLAESLTAENAKLLSELRKTSPDVKPVEKMDSVVTIPKQEVPESVTPGQDRGTVWQDQHHRFVFQVDLMKLYRKQEFSVQTVVLQSPTGIKLLNQTVTEHDPETHQPILDEPPILVRETNFMVVKDAPSVAIFHPRVVAGVGYLGQVGLGVQVANLERYGGLWSHANLSVLGLYDVKAKKADGVLLLGFRPFNTTISIGPAYFFPRNALGAAATIELTR